MTATFKDMASAKSYAKNLKKRTGDLVIIRKKANGTITVETYGIN